MSKNILLYSISVLILSLCACNSDEPKQNIPSNVCYDFATLVTATKEGCTFTLRKGEDTPLVTYTSTINLSSDTTYHQNQRLLIMYTPKNGEPYTSGPINLYGIRLLDQTNPGIVLESEKGTSQWASNPMKLTIMTRTGDYLNMQADLCCKTPALPKTLILAVDSTKIDEEMPEVHVIYRAAQETAFFNYFTSYASWDISEIWNLPTCKGIVVKYQSENGIKQESFTKGSLDIRPIE